MAVVMIVCFLGLIWLPTADHFFGLDHAQKPNENRPLVGFPEFTPSREGVRAFPAGVEAYFRDHFGFRNRLIRLERKLKDEWFHELIMPDVLIGREGWLFFSGDYMVEHFQGLKLLSDEDLANWQALLEKRRDWLARRGIKYVFSIPPDKHSIYPEELPEWLSGLQATNKLDQFVAHMRAHSTVEVLDLRPAILEAKNTNKTYLRLDTHWNTYGGFVAYQALVKTLGQQLPGLTPPLELADFDVSPVPLAGGDLSRMLSEQATSIEPYAFVFTPRSPRTKLNLMEVSNRFPKKWDPLTGPIASFYDGARGKAMVFRDSFAGSWVEFLGYHFNEVIYLWQHEWNAEFIEREKPLVVIDEMLERFFCSSDPVKLMKKDALP